MTEQNTILIEVAYALPNEQKILSLRVVGGTTVFDGVMQSGMDNLFPGLELVEAKLGIFGKAVAKPQQQVLREGDRIEIYRPLMADPKEVRKARAAKVKAEKVAAKAAQ
ncbi:MAG: putative ubiquitin-RnfH superfamily antitoxin RatB of RatAB toxin-antitoxin module [Pseudohongiellaceae bacterium]|jgi:putative ubiquitin-RnfH superfamily antitoxin RatB of RatAB toxin-antitoxin module